MFIINKDSIKFFFIVFIIFILSIFVSLRPEELTYDYDIYKIMYDSPEIRSGELLFQFLRFIFSFFEYGFIYLLFIHCFVALSIKVYCVNKTNDINLILFLVFYAFSYFILWEMTQIRIGLAISFYMLIFFIKSKNWKIFFAILSIITHTSLIFLYIPLLIHKLFKGNFILFLTFSSISAYLLNEIIFFTGYIAYDASEYSADYNLLTLKNFIILSLVYYCYKFNSVNLEFITKNSMVSLYLIIVAFFVGNIYPAISIRLTDIATYLIILSFILTENNKSSIILKILLITLISLFYFNLSILSDKAIFDLEVFLSIF